MPKTSILKGYFGESEDQNLVDEKPVEKPSIFKMWKSESTKTEISRERSIDTESIIRQNSSVVVHDGLNKLHLMEVQFRYLIESMSYYFGSCDVARPGLSNFLQVLALQETKHVDAVRTHMSDRGLPVIFDDIVKPSVEWDTPLSAMETLLGATQSINESWLQLHKACRKYEDPCTEVLVKKFICEHVGLINRLGCHVINLRRIEGNPTGVYLYDQKSFGGELLIPDILDTDTDN
jgi:ferritin